MTTQTDEMSRLVRHRIRAFRLWACTDRIYKSTKKSSSAGLFSDQAGASSVNNTVGAPPDVLSCPKNKFEPLFSGPA